MLSCTYLFAECFQDRPLVNPLCHGRGKSCGDQTDPLPISDDAVPLWLIRIAQNGFSNPN